MRKVLHNVVRWGGEPVIGSRPHWALLALYRGSLTALLVIVLRAFG